MLNRAFKAPAHVSRLDALLEVYPDAYIVWMHRDPLWVTTSYSLLLALFKRMKERPARMSGSPSRSKSNRAAPGAMISGK